MVQAIPGSRRVTLGGDKNYDTRDHADALRSLNVTPHVAQNDTNRKSAIDGRTTRHPGYAVSMRKRKRVEEIYNFYRPPLEAKVEVLGNGTNFKLMVVHPKSKGIFNAMDLAHWERESKRNQLKLYAECTWIRRRVDEWLKGGDEVIVMGDVNDGPGMDNYERTYGRSAVEIIMGDLFAPDKILRSHAGAPKWTATG